ncbi:MAG: ABC transporter ATP-binding protein/permease [Turicibacter sp.]
MINKRLITVCDDSKKYMMLTVFSSWIGIVCNILIILLVGQFINVMVEGATFDVMTGATIFTGLKSFHISENINLLTAFIIIICLLVIKFYSHQFYGRFSFKASANARVTLRTLIFDKLLKLGMNYQETQKTSAIVQVAIEGVEQLEIYFGRYLPQFFYAMLAPITLFVVISFISIKSALVFMVCVPLIPISIILIMKMAKRILKQYWNNYANLGDTFLENLQGLTTLKVFNQDAQKHVEMNEEAEKFRKITMKVLSMQLNSINVMDLIAFGGAALGTIVALFEFKSGNITVGELIVIILLSSEFFIPLRLLGSYFHIAMNGMAASDRIFELLDQPIDELEIYEELIADQAIHVEVQNICFSYDGEREVLKHITMELTPGGVVAVVGESGSGKSTLASLLLAQNHVNKGQILINGIEISKIKAESLYQNVGIVSAHSHIFKGTIKENLLMANAKATIEEMYEALKVAHLYEFVMSLPNQLETLITESGNSLSGGQKQRLALARIILRNCQMIVFDEATSNVDVESEEKIWDAIYDLGKSKTILVISHRLASVKLANMIYVFKEGELAEAGNHHTLMEKNKKYAQLVKNQLELENIAEVK